MSATIKNGWQRQKMSLLGKYKMTRAPELVREFIHDCLYNKRDGYFQRNVNIFSTSSKLNFTAMEDEVEYDRKLHKLYNEQTKRGKFYQLWHTPSELFSPWYGQGVAEYLVRNRGDMPLIIYEIGPGNGTLCRDILDYIAQKYPEIYEMMEYHLIEISNHLVQAKLSPLQISHSSPIRIHNKSFLDWNIRDPRSTFVICAEVFDNLPQDRIRFTKDGLLEQALVVTNDEARYHDGQTRITEVFIPVSDKLIIDTVNCLDEVGHPWPSLRRSYESLYDMWPLSIFPLERPWSSEFIPTTAMLFFNNLRRWFPNHQLLLADFDKLPGCIAGHGAPVVQTRYEGETISCSTYLLERGLFDIFFAINFPLMAKMYSKICSNPATIITHHDFCKKYANIAMTRTKSGYSPLLEDFVNVSFLISKAH